MSNCATCGKLYCFSRRHESLCEKCGVFDRFVSADSDNTIFQCSVCKKRRIVQNQSKTTVEEK